MLYAGERGRNFPTSPAKYKKRMSDKVDNGWIVIAILGTVATMLVIGLVLDRLL